MTTSVSIDGGNIELSEIHGGEIESVVDRKLEVVAERLRGDMHNHIWEEMREQGSLLRDQLQQFMIMFSS